MADDTEQPHPDAPGADAPAFSAANSPEGAEAQENASGDTLSPLKNENGSPFGKANKFGKWSVVKAKMVPKEAQSPTLSESFQRLVRQKAVQEGVDLPLSEALRKEEAKTRRISKMKFTTSTVEQMKTEYHTRNAKDAKALEMEARPRCSCISWFVHFRRVGLSTSAAVAPLSRPGYATAAKEGDKGRQMLVCSFRKTGSRSRTYLVLPTGAMQACHLRLGIHTRKPPHPVSPSCKMCT
jgi:hypothetical protein